MNASAAAAMSKEDRDLLNSRLPQLISKISIEDGMLLAHLRARGVLTQLEEENIRTKGDRGSQVKCLLDVLLRRDSNTVDKLIYSLRDTGQSNVVDEWLRQPRLPDEWGQVDTESSVGATNFLSQTDANLLEKYRPQMMSDIQLVNGSLLAELRSRSVLTVNEERFIRGITGNSNAVGHTVDLLLRKGPNSLEIFLHALNHSGHSFVVEYLRSPTTPDETCFVRGGRSSEELQEALKENLQDKLDEWKTALEEGVSSREGLLPYINQPCTLKTKAFQAYQDNTIELVENSRPGDRLVIYGEAGQGKTTLLKQIARSWIERSNQTFVDNFDFVFLIPLRLVGKIPLLNIICDELELIPSSNMGNLKEALDRKERRTLFLLDSFEELREDVKAKNRPTAIDDLITGRLFKKSTVVITSRPGSGLEQAEDQTTAQLQDLPEHEVKKVIKRHFGENEKAVDKVQRSFPAMAYLQKPINLALFIFIITQNKHLTLSYTQAELFSLVLQYIMLAFAKKKKVKEFIPQPGSYITNKAIPRDIRRLFSVIAKKCYQQRKQNDVKIHVEDADDLQEYLNFGLFTAGTDANTVVLPHRLFIEYFTAAHLAENPEVWKTLFEEIKEESERKSLGLKPLLLDVVRSMGLEHILRFVVALSPQPQLDQVCQQVGNLFVLERKKIDDDGEISTDNYQLANFKYYTELMSDCCDENGKRLLAAALLDAPVRDVTHRDRAEEDRSHVLFQYLDNKQRVAFVKNIYNLDLKDGKSTLSCTGQSGGNKRLVIRDRFVLALVSWLNCIITADELYIEGNLRSRLDLPASVFTRMPGVRQLTLEYCTLCEGLPDYIMSDVDRSATVQHSSLCPTNSSLERVELVAVKGLEHCDVITSRQCQLVMKEQGDVRVCTLKTCFPRVSELNVSLWTTVVYETEEELTSWLSTVQTVRGELELAPQHEGESVCLSHLLNMLADKEWGNLRLSRSTLLLDVRDTSATVKQNKTFSTLELRDCKGDVDLGQLLEVCSRQCPQLKKVTVIGCQLQAIVRDTSDAVKQNNTLGVLWLWDCKGDLDLGQLLEVCSRQCPQLEVVAVGRNQLQVIVRDTSATVHWQNNTLSELNLHDYKGDVTLDLGQLLEVCSHQCPLLKGVGVYDSNLVFDDERVESVKQLPGLQKFKLWESAVHTPAGRRLSEQKAEQLLHRLLPSADIEVVEYPLAWVDTESKSDLEPESLPICTRDHPYSRLISAMENPTPYLDLLD